MSQHFEAIYENGLLRPLEPLALPDLARVELEVRAVLPETLPPVMADELAAQEAAHAALTRSLAELPDNNPADGWDSSRVDEILYGWKK
jgi:predicted DNA-binding antitoxin AbrB/MazE fold protein